MGFLLVQGDSGADEGPGPNGTPFATPDPGHSRVPRGGYVMAQQETADETRAAVEQLTRQVRDLESQLAALAKRVLRIEADYYEDKEDPGELS